MDNLIDNLASQYESLLKKLVTILSIILPTILTLLFSKTTSICPHNFYKVTSVLLLFTPFCFIILVGILILIINSPIDSLYKKSLITKNIVTKIIVMIGLGFFILGRSFLSTPYYACLKTGPDPLSSNNRYAEVQALAQTSGWFMMIGLIILAVIISVVYLIRNRPNKTQILHNKYIKIRTNRCDEALTKQFEWMNKKSLDQLLASAESNIQVSDRKSLIKFMDQLSDTIKHAYIFHKNAY